MYYQCSRLARPPNPCHKLGDYVVSVTACHLQGTWIYASHTFTDGISYQSVVYSLVINHLTVINGYTGYTTIVLVVPYRHFIGLSIPMLLNATVTSGLQPQVVKCSRENSFNPITSHGFLGEITISFHCFPLFSYGSDNLATSSSTVPADPGPRSPARHLLPSLRLHQAPFLQGIVEGRRQHGRWHRDEGPGREERNSGVGNGGSHGW